MREMCAIKISVLLKQQSEFFSTGIKTILIDHYVHSLVPVGIKHRSFILNNRNSLS